MAQFGRRNATIPTVTATTGRAKRAALVYGGAIAATVLLVATSVFVYRMWPGTHGPQGPMSARADKLFEKGSLTCAANLKAAFLSARSAGPVRFTAKSALGHTYVESVTEIVDEQTARIRYQRDGGTSDVILTKGRMWRNNGEGWQWVVDPRMGDVAAAPKLLLDDLFPDTSDVRCLGPRDRSGIAMPVVSYAYRTKGGRFTGLALFDPQSGMPVELESVTLAEGRPQIVRGSVEFDDGIVISAPKRFGVSTPDLSHLRGQTM